MDWNSCRVHNTQWSRNSTLSCRLEPFRLCVCACLCACACLDVPERERRQRQRRAGTNKRSTMACFIKFCPKTTMLFSILFEAYMIWDPSFSSKRSQLISEKRTKLPSYNTNGGSFVFAICPQYFYFLVWLSLRADPKKFSQCLNGSVRTRAFHQFANIFQTNLP